MSETVRVACPHDCPDTCAMLVTVDDGVATRIQGDPEAPFTEGSLCTKVSHYLERTYSSSAGKYGLKATLGGSVGMDPERFDEANLIILWGANPVVSNLHLWGRVQAAKRRGAKVVAIDPYRSLSAEKCTQQVALLPAPTA